MTLALNPNLRLVKPIAKTLSIECNIRGHQRNAFERNVFGNSISTLTLPWTPTSAELVEVYANGRRMLSGYTISGRTVTLNPAIKGRVDFICDPLDPIANGQEWCEIPINNLIFGTSLVDAEENATDRRPGPNIATYCRPVVIVRPDVGFCRESLYRDSLLYAPPRGYNGMDAITYVILTDFGQLSEPKCININVKAP